MHVRTASRQTRPTNITAMTVPSSKCAKGASCLTCMISLYATSATRSLQLAIVKTKLSAKIATMNAIRVYVKTAANAKPLNTSCISMVVRSICVMDAGLLRITRRNTVPTSGPLLVCARMAPRSCVLACLPFRCAVLLVVQSVQASLSHSPDPTPQPTANPPRPPNNPNQPTTQIQTEIQNAISILTHWSSEVKTEKVCENTLKFSLDLFVP